MLSYQFYSRTHVGRVRENNEDAVAFDAAAQLALLADGMGGYNAGEVASSMAIALIQADLSRYLLPIRPGPNSAVLHSAVTAAVENANVTIWSCAATQPDCSGMGTTLVMAVFLGTSVLLAHVGDSRCYRLRGSILARMTRDHSVLQEQIDAGLVSLEDAPFAPNRNLVTRALGVMDMVEVEIAEHPANSGDLYLLCSDGLTDMLTDDAIAALLTAPGTLAERATQLVDAANAAGGRDNISVLLAQAEAVA